MKIISIEEHFVKREITNAWATSAIGQEGTGSFDEGEIGQRLETSARVVWQRWTRAE